MRVLRHELPRNDGTRLHVEDKACVNAAEVVGEQAGGEGVFCGMHGDSGECANSSDQVIITQQKREGMKIGLQNIIKNSNGKEEPKCRT